MAAQTSTPTRTGPPGSSDAGVRRRIAAIHLPSTSERVRPALRFVGLELLLWASLYGLYLAVRGLSIGSPDEAVANARSIVEFERDVGLS
jgi:hypothetical protein